MSKRTRKPPRELNYTKEEKQIIAATIAAIIASIIVLAILIALVAGVAQWTK